MVKKIIAILLMCSICLGTLPLMQANAYSVLPNYSVCEVGDIGDIYFGNEYGVFESTYWSSSDSSTVRIIDTTRLGYCTIQCLKPGKVSINLAYHYSLQEPEVIGTNVYWYWVEHISYFSYTITVRSPQCILKNTSATAKTAALTFDAPTGASSVMLQQSSDGGSTWKPATTAALNSSSTSATASGLAPVTTYQFKLRVVGGKREGDSNVVAVTTGDLVSGITLDNTNLTVVRGLTGTLAATVLPANAGNKNVNWQTGNANLATVKNNNDGTATITANATQTGTVNITATTEDGNFSKTCQVTIINPTMVPPVPSVPAGNINIGTKVSLSVPVPDPTIYYTLDGSTPTKSSPKYTAPIEITASCTLKAFATSSNMFDSGVLSVAYTAVVGVTGVAFQDSSLSLPIGETTAPVVKISPGNAYNKAVTYSSSDDSVLTVAANGIVTAKGIGSAVITVTTADGGFSNTCTITVVPKPIYTATDFGQIGNSPSYLSSYPYLLMADIQITNLPQIGTFSGIFDGGGHKISGVSGKAIFAQNSGTIKNLFISGTINSSYSDLGGLTTTNNGLITNCTNEINIVNSYNESNAIIRTAGIAAINNGSIEYCNNKGQISSICNGFDQTQITGGITGESSGYIKYCTNSGEISGNDYSGSSYNYFLFYSYVGGIAGRSSTYNGKGEISDSYNTGKVTAKGPCRYYYSGLKLGSAHAFAGGITGTSGTIQNCFNTGVITAYTRCYVTYSGSYTSDANAGGISGDLDNGTALYCYNTGAVTASANGDSGTVFYLSVLGIASSATNSFCLNNVSDGGGSAAIKNSTQLKQQSTYTGFDFDSVWTMDATVNDGYPYLIQNAVVPLAPPKEITASGKTDKTVTLSWNAVAGAKAYDVYNGTTKLTDIPITRTTFTVTGLTESTDYDFTVKAVNGAEESTPSVPFRVTTNETPKVTAPPTEVTVLNITSTTADLSWKEVQGATGYNVYHGAIKLTATPITTTTYTVTGLKSSTDYALTVKAVNEVGESLPSEEVNITTKKSGGDMSGDHQIDLIDVTLLSRYVAGWTVQVDTTALDVSGDGKVDLVDVTLLSRYVAGWNVTLH